MKLLIIAGPYEADRIRRAAVPAGFETVAVEPGESLSGWITATRPDIVVLAPQVLNADPAVALAKVRAVPRGRVPVFLVGDADDEPRLRTLADGYFVRPIAPGDLVARARALLQSVPPRDASGPVASEPREAQDEFARGAETPKSGPQALKAPPSLRPLVAEGTGEVRPPTPVRPVEPVALLSDLAAGIDAALEAQMRSLVEAARVELGSARRPATGERALAKGAASPRPPEPRPARPEPSPREAKDEALQELHDESSQKTVEVPAEVVAKMVDDAGRVRGRTAEPAADGGIPAPYQTGIVGEPDVALLLGRLVRERLTGWLTLRRDQAEKAIVFRAGQPILAGSNQPEDRMGEMLVRQGRLTAEQQSRSAEILVNTGRRLGQVLLDMGLIKAGELQPVVRQHYEEIIYSVFAWQRGDWVLSPDRPEKEETVLLETPGAAVILEGIRRKYSAERSIARLGGPGAVLRLSTLSGTSDLLGAMALSDEERAVVELLDGTRALDDVREAAGVPDEVAFGVALALFALGACELVAPAQVQADESGTAVGAKEPPELTPERARDQAIDRARVRARHALVVEGDYFQILGLPRDASAHEIRRAHETLTRELSAGALDPDVAVELSAELAEIRAVLDESYRVLGDARLRRRYQASLSPPVRRAE